MMIDYKGSTDIKELKSYVEYLISAYQSLAAEYQKQNQTMVTVLGYSETYKLENLEMKSQIKSLIGEIKNLYDELGEYKYSMKIDLVQLLGSDEQLRFEFVDGYTIN